MSKTQGRQSFKFKAEIQQLLHILVHSLYRERDIFLRELISNASDALHRIQFEMLTNRDVLDPDAELAIRVSFDETAKTLTVSDTGIGMTREELVENLGTIAHSGAMAFLKQVQATEQPISTDLIGQFGVGFYSAFMVAEEITVSSRSYRPDAEAWSWTSRGENSYTLAPADKPARGTSVEIKLKEDAAEFASAWRLEQIIKKHSDFVAFPIYVGDKAQAANRQTALWRQSPREVEADQYDEFYKQLTLDFEKPLAHVHMVTDAPVQMYAVLYVPAKRERGVLALRTDHGLKLYSRKVLIQDYCKDLLPNHFRFVEGVVDSEDLPLNISRETIQATRLMEKMKSNLSRKLIDELERLADQDAESYESFWEQFGGFIKEGVATDIAGREALLPLLRFRSSKSDGGLVSLAEYAGRMKEEQKAIYYILGEDPQSVARSPHLDYFRKHDLEVLYLTETIDSFMVLGLREFAGKPVKNVDDAGLELPEIEAPAEGQEQLPAGQFEALLERFRQTLGERVTDVRESRLLSDSPCRLVSPEGDVERDMARVRRLLDQSFEVPKKLIEINRGHGLIRQLARLASSTPDEALIDMSIEQLY
ncbi:MAG: molecular chaperone HtpG, partial [Thermoflexales bacterium]|nr:molecular chaperone HtpG [Thermoflexales bacterium]